MRLLPLGCRWDKTDRAKILCTFDYVEVKIEMSTRSDKNQLRKPTSDRPGAVGNDISVHRMKKNKNESEGGTERHVCEEFLCVGD